ncbi:hypothetical protein KUTeg_012415 [Tegillarca granosa]|uniref:DUF4371 domain-containing protein n=1 Tax=Tegillarca granosa TaxID=220873 RepID=A0ABQ9EZG0_TEGGR|nr:hypothetical protein KUTeg_012415 [Tegillarca granosa]
MYSMRKKAELSATLNDDVRSVTILSHKDETENPIKISLLVSSTALNNLNKKHSFSLLIDGATDSLLTENELIYIRTVEDGGVPVNHYISCEDIKNANVKGILKTIDNAFEKSNIDNWKEKVVGFGSDGASVNLGFKGGVAALLKHDVPHLISVHCVAHRLELAANNAIKHHAFMSDLQDMLQNVYKQYHYSPKGEI